MKFRASIALLYFLIAGHIASAQEPADLSATSADTAAPTAAAKFTRGEQPAWVESIPIPAAVSQPAPVVLLLSDTQFYWADSKACYVHRAVKINETAVLSKAGQQVIEFNPEYQTLTLHTLRVIRGNEVLNRRESAKLRFVEREPDMANSIYDGMVSAVLLVDDLRVGDALEIAYTIEGSNPVFGDKVSEYASWEHMLPTERRHISALYPATRNISYRYVGGLDESVRATPSIGRKNGLTQMVFDKTHIKAVDSESNVPQGFQLFTWLQFSEYKSWQEVAHWAQELFRQPEPNNKEFNDLVARLRALEKPNAQVAAALRFVQADIRYTSIAIGVNSHRPYPPATVLERRYGDCKDKSTLLSTLLQKLGIDAKPVLVSTNFRHGFSGWLPSPNLFNHVIVRVIVDGNVYWLDPTALQEPVDIQTLGYLHGGNDVLVIDHDTVAPTAIPQGPANIVDEQQTLLVDSIHSPANLIVSTTYNGFRAENFRSTLRQYTSDQLSKHFLDAIRVAYPGARWEKPYEVKDDTRHNSVTITRNFIVDDVTEFEDNQWHIRQRADRILDFLELPDTADRKAPYALEYPTRLLFSLRVYLPLDRQFNGQQEASAVTSEYFKLRSTWHFRGVSAFIQYDLTSFAEEVPAKKLKDFSADVRKARTLMGSWLNIPEQHR